MTATLYAQVCPTCGMGYIEPVPVGLCPVCRYYGVASYLVEVEDPVVAMALALDRAAHESMPPLPRRRRSRSRRSRHGPDASDIGPEAAVNRAASSVIAL